MKSELDLIQEYSELADAKIESFGELPVADERRFSELKAFFDDLLERRRSLKVAVSERYSSKEIRKGLPHRARLRIPAEMSLFFCHQDAYAPARLVNMSRGGLHLGSEIFLTPGASLTLYMPNLGRGYENLFETSVDVVWSAKRIPRRGMGVRFRELSRDTEQQLDDYVVSFLRERLSKANRLDFRPSFARLTSTQVAGA
jgi:hypothetical protein